MYTRVRAFARSFTSSLNGFSWVRTGDLAPSLGEENTVKQWSGQLSSARVIPTRNASAGPSTDLHCEDFDKLTTFNMLTNFPYYHVSQAVGGML